MTLADEATDWMDGLFDPDVGLLWNPPDSVGVPARTIHLVPQSAWYAVGLARRADSGRIDRIVTTLCDGQYRTPGTVWDGTFPRFHEAPVPTDGAVEWEDYDPNWRQFLGTSLTMLLRRHGDLLDAPLRQRVEDTVAYAVTAEPVRRIGPSYTNIAVKHAWLLVEWGDEDAGLALAGKIRERQAEHGAVEEFNSPTYDGITLWGLRLWATESSSPQLREWGAAMEADLWHRIGERYHAGLRNVAGPYTRAYGMDMTETFSTLGLWVAEAVGPDVAPLPDLSGRFLHAHDRCMAPLPPLVGCEVPDEVEASLRAFTGERTVRTVVSERTNRVATAWLADDVMIGAEHGEVDWGGWDQHVPATVHWRLPNGRVGWLRLWCEGPPRATAESGVLRVDGSGTFQVGGVPGVEWLAEGETSLPGLRVRWTRKGDTSTLEVEPG